MFLSFPFFGRDPSDHPQGSMRPTLGRTASLGIKAGSMVNASVKSAAQTKHTWLLYLNASFSEETFVTLSQWNDQDSSLSYSLSLVFRLPYNRPSFVTIRVNPGGPPPPDPRQSCVLRNFSSAGHSAHLHVKQYCHLYCPLRHKTLTAYHLLLLFGVTPTSQELNCSETSVLYIRLLRDTVSDRSSSSAVISRH